VLLPLAFCRSCGQEYYTVRRVQDPGGREVALPLYEAKMIHHFTHRFGDYADRAGDSQSTALPQVPPERLQDSSYVPLPRYWVERADVNERLENRWDFGWLFGWRRNSRSTDVRSFVCNVLPRTAIGDSLFLMLSIERVQPILLLAAVLSSFVFDYVARQKAGGMNNSYFLVKQLPVLIPEALEREAPLWGPASFRRWLSPRLLELVFTAWDLQPYAEDCDYAGPPFKWDELRRTALRCEIDAAFFHLYGVGRDELHHIMDSFSIVRDEDFAEHGDYRTKLVILDIYDRMQRAIDTGEPYQTLVDPPPADPRVAHPDDPEMRRRFSAVV